MNKIYKIVFNRTLGTWTVASELAKGRSKAGSNSNTAASPRFIIKGLALSVLAVLSSSAAWTVINGPEHDSDTATVKAGESAHLFDSLSGGKISQHTLGVMNRSGNPVRMVWYSNAKDDDGHTAQTKADNAGYNLGTHEFSWQKLEDSKAAAQATGTEGKDEWWSSIINEGLANGIDAYGWTAQTNPNDVIINHRSSEKLRQHQS
ncbi:ESPR domain-containing protein [Suttonella indologenes]|uniref:Type V secretory pathway, adhesin AidA n=1 Tax=Suttonella indologenes TaxID=13276 RepID=A0A380MJW9_9GAMM|nr:ESPR domain-containing protein [Suttonella indologenes]SUO92307.1 Type V secretory pathway, adhesin AidA [Suttonella indologenes]